MDDQIDSHHQNERLFTMMNMVRKTADSNLAYLTQVQTDLHHAHQLSERIYRLKRQDLTLLVRRFQTSLERKVKSAKRILGDFCTMVVLHDWVLKANFDSCEEYILCINLLFEAHHDTFAWANHVSEEPHPAGGLLRGEVIEGVHQSINIMIPFESPPGCIEVLNTSSELEDLNLNGLNNMVSEAEEVAASNQRIEAIIELIETLSFSLGESGESFTGTFHARHLASTMKLHQMISPFIVEHSTIFSDGGYE